MKKYFALLLLALNTCACQTYQTIPVTLPDGFVVQARVADTPAKQKRGLMYIKHLPENEGMLFIFEQEQGQVFWMKNTLIDLDMVFIDSTHTVTDAVSEVPHSYLYTPDDDVAYVPGYGQYVLELAAKTAAKHHVVPGAKILFTYEP